MRAMRCPEERDCRVESEKSHLANAWAAVEEWRVRGKVRDVLEGDPR